MHVVLRIVHQAEGRHRAGAQAQPLLHTLLRGEGELSLMQALLQVVDSHRLLAIEDNQVVAVALMVTEEEVFEIIRLADEKDLIYIVSSHLPSDIMRKGKESRR